MKALALALAMMGGAAAAAPAIRVNQLGFAPDAAKVAVVPNVAASEFEVVRADNGASVLRGKLGAPALWKPSEETVRLADFSSLSTPGTYRIKVAGTPVSDPFAVTAGVYRELTIASIRAFYLNRAGTELPSKFAGAYARPLAHPDDKVLVHASAASASRPEGTVIASPKGWYDAGDYNKYVVNSGISTYTLLAAYEHYPEYFARQSLNIPESGNKLPDILDEALWNLEWMLSMQDPADGGVYNKVTNKRFDAFVMPHKANSGPRYVVAKSTAAALDFAATMAAASRVYRPFDAALAERMLSAAESAWKWAQANPAVLYKNPPDIATGEYGDGNVADERVWAAAELYIGTGKDSYWHAMKAQSVQADVPGWGNVQGLAWMSLAQHMARLTPAADRKLIAERIDSLAAKLAAGWKASAYQVTAQPADFVWGSNAVVMNQSMMLLAAYQLNGKRDYLDAAQSGLDYVLGRNATGYSFVTGFGARPPMHPHHRPSEADGVAAPVPGWLVGGPQPGQQEGAECKGVAYPSKLPALSYLDHLCSYSANEVAINWNAPLVYVSAALDALSWPARANQPGAGMDKPAVTLAAIARQEQTLQFTSFSNAMALELGNKVVEMAKAANKVVAVDITMNGTQLFFHGMDGTTKDNADWIRRKSNLVNKTGHASFYIHTDAVNQGRDFDNLPEFDKRDYAAHGGSFPLVIKGKGQVGTITVSGLPGAEDHAMVVNALKAYLKVEL